MADKNTTSPAAAATPTDTAASPQQQMLVDFGPLLVFFAAYKFYDLKIAIVIFIVIMAAALSWAKLKIGHISGAQKLTFAIVTISGSLTLYFDNKTFFYMKPTLVYALFIIILGVGMLRGRLFMKDMLSKAIEGDIPQAIWNTLTKQAMVFFLLMMAANETIWRTQTEETWISFKVFGFTGATLVFTFWIVFQLMRYSPHEDASNDEQP